MPPLGGRYVYEGGMASFVGKACTITSLARVKSFSTCLVRFDDDHRERVVEIKNLTPEGTTTMKNIKTTVLAAVKTLLKPLDADSAKEQAVRRLGVAAELVRLGEADKKKAKAELTALGVITGGEQTGVVFDSERYVVTATTKAASSRLDAGELEKAMEREGLSMSARRRIVGAATVLNKAATSFSVESK